MDYNAKNNFQNIGKVCTFPERLMTFLQIKKYNQYTDMVKNGSHVKSIMADFNEDQHPY